MDTTVAINVLTSSVPPTSKPGPRPGYHLGHALMAVLHLSEMKKLSREDLSGLLGVSEGTVKTLIAYMQLAHIVVTSSSGTSLSSFGAEVASAVRNVVTTWMEVKLFYLATDRRAVAFRLKSSSVKVLDPLKLRDGVVRYGGTGSTVAKYEGGKFSIPMVLDDLSSASKEDADELRKLTPEEGNLLVIVSSRSTAIARTSFASALAELLSQGS